MIKKHKKKLYDLLRWTEKWTKTDMVYFAQGSFWLSIGQGVSMLSAFLLSIAFANLIPSEVYGHYRYILSLSALLSIPSLSGMQTSINRAAAQNLDGILKKGMHTSAKYGLLGGLASLTIALYYFLNNNIDLTFSFLIIAFFAPILGPLNSYSSFLQGKKEFKLITKINVIRELILFSLTLATLYFTNNVFTILLVYFSSRTIINICLTWFTLKYKVANNNYTKESLGFGKHLSLMGIFEIIAGQIDKVLIWHYLGGAQLAIYSFAMAPLGQIQGLIMKNIVTLALPKLAESKIENIKKTLPLKIYKLLGIVFVIAIVYFLLAPFFYSTFFPQYVESIKYSRLYLLAIIPMPVGLLSTVLVAHGRKKELYILSFSLNILKIVLFLILLPFYGVLGAISTLVVVNILGYAQQFYYFKKLINQ
jgi:O-antigen/teichoic acid export membrane protein